MQLSTGGSVHDPLEERLKVLDAEPDSCSLTMGTTNFGDDVFLNPWPFVKELYQLALDRGIAPEFELFDLGQVHALGRLFREFGVPVGGKAHVDFVMGVPGGMPGTAPALVAAVAALPDEVTSWSATGIGRSTLSVAMASLSMGGHLRVGMEDVLTIGRGVPVDSNAQLVERAVELGRIGPADADDARRVSGAARPRLTGCGRNLTELTALGERIRAYGEATCIRGRAPCRFRVARSCSAPSRSRWPSSSPRHRPSPSDRPLRRSPSRSPCCRSSRTRERRPGLRPPH